MRTDTHPIRVTGLAATATTLVALLAMSATVSAAPAPRAVDAQGRSSPSESHVVRAVAAAVAAAARDLLVGERGTGAVALLEPPAGCRAQPPSRVVTVVAVSFTAPTLLSERLLDLPPPAS